MQSVYPALALVQGTSGPSVWQHILESFPTDPASLFTLALCVGVGVLVVVTGLSSGKKGGGPGASAP